MKIRTQEEQNCIMNNVLWVVAIFFYHMVSWKPDSIFKLSSLCQEGCMRICNKRRHLRKSLVTTCASLQLYNYIDYNSSLSPLCTSRQSLAFLACFFLQEPRPAHFWCSNLCPLEEHGIFITNASTRMFLIDRSLLFVHIHVAVSLIYCLASVHAS